MGYRNTSGLILRRRDVFEEDQEVSILTPTGCVSARAPNARRSQKRFCGRLEPPNNVSVRLYRSQRQSQWVVSSVDLDDVFADLLRDETTRNRLWPVLSLFQDLFPNGESPGPCLPHLKNGLDLLKQGFEPTALATNRILAKAAKRSGIAFETGRCVQCDNPFKTSNSRGELKVSPETGPVCARCGSSETLDKHVWSLPVSVLDLFGQLTDCSWEKVCARRVRHSDLDELEKILYRLFHYHFEISLETLSVRKAL